jgi:hypothetical protein
MAKPDTAVGFISPGQVYAEFAVSLARLDSGRVMSIKHGSGKRPEDGRNALIEDMLESGATWFWMIDADMTFGPGLLDRLHDTARWHKAQMVAGLCYTTMGDEVYPAFWYKYRPSEIGSGWDEKEPFTIENVGSACSLIHRDVLEKVRTYRRARGDMYSWYGPGIFDGEPTVYDQAFGLSVRAAGYNIWLDPMAKLGHVQTYTLTEDMLT